MQRHMFISTVHFPLQLALDLPEVHFSTSCPLLPKGISLSPKGENHSEVIALFGDFSILLL